MRTRSLVWLMSTAVVSSTVMAFGQVQTAEPMGGPQTQPSVMPASPAAATSRPAVRPPLPPPDNSGIAPASLPAVKACLEHPRAWQKAIQAVMDKIRVPELRQQLGEGLGNLTPQIAKGLIDRRGDTAYATVAVYRQAGETGAQAALVLAFEGFGGRLDPTFYGRVLADMPRPPDVADRPGIQPAATQASAPLGLVLDASASVYLCFFISNDGLCAGAVPHETFKHELAAAFLQGRKAPPNVVADSEASIQQAAVQEWLDQGVRQSVIQQQQAQLAALEAQAASTNYGPGYDDSLLAGDAYPSYYYGDWGLYGWGWYNPIILLPGRPLHHDWNGQHWRKWNWRGYHANSSLQTETPLISVNVSPGVGTDTISTPPADAQAASPPNDSVAPPPSEVPVVRQPVQPAAPARSTGTPPGPARTSSGNSGASGGSRPAGGGTAHGGPAHR